MKVMVTGDRGYIGSVLVDQLAKLQYDIIGLDTGFYDDCELEQQERVYRSITKDIRDVAAEDLVGVDAVIHLAALSNDPLGELKAGITEEINYRAAVRLARLAKNAGVSRFIYASSQSMYGIADSDAELDEDNSVKHPITAYAKTKWQAEQELKTLVSETFCVVCFRPSTVFGWSPRLRCDIIFNNLLACAYTTGKIEIKSDGTPWRPIVHVQDVCKAFIAGLTAPVSLINGRSYNVGIENGNYTVRQIAETVSTLVAGCDLVFTGEHGSDARTYRVGFNRILTELQDYYQPAWDLVRAGQEMLAKFEDIDFKEQDFRGPRCTRLAQLDDLLASGKLDDNLFWVKHE
ncbi:NAD-dependent epimerase/dehydratase family protein [Rheinheimera texasensis]|uniref:NAD-dependent epimerase/dehydratase family protein n=1 Tax=Rheinheimera texasensis TaxID=306205 RepID=UPI0004E28133|nr:SDR family oxidoreductase [Rheinheimera texasensis]